MSLQHPAMRDVSPRSRERRRKRARERERKHEREREKRPVVLHLNTPSTIITKTPKTIIIKYQYYAPALAFTKKPHGVPARPPSFDPA